MTGAFAQIGLASMMGVRGAAPPFVCPTTVSALALSSDYAYVYDIDQGCVLYDRSSTTTNDPGSVVKLLAMLVLLDWRDPETWDDVWTFVAASDAWGGSTMGLEDGDQCTVLTLVHGVLVSSGNDATRCIARNVGDEMYAAAGNTGEQGEARFIEAMRAKATALGMSGFTIRNVHGGTGAFDGGISNAFRTIDIATLAEAALTNETLQPILALTAYDAEIVGGSNPRTLNLTRPDPLLDLPEHIASKTGNNSQGHYSQVSLWSAPNGSRVLIATQRALAIHYRRVDVLATYQHAAMDYPYLDPAHTLDETDPYWDDVVLLVDAEDGQIKDHSQYEHPVSVSGATIENDVRLRGSKTIAFDGTDDYLRIPHHSALNMGSAAAWTWEAWVLVPSLPNENRKVFGKYDYGANKREIGFRVNSSRHMEFLVSTNGSSFQNRIFNPNGDTQDDWYAGTTALHLALIRHSGNIQMYIQGVPLGSAYNIGTNAVFSGDADLTIGALLNNGTPEQFWFGRIGAVRITKAARWTEQFFPPPRPFPRSGPS